MAVIPISRASMSVAPTPRASVPMPTPMSMPMPGQQSWVWDGSSWQWVDDPDCCPPPGWCPPTSGWAWCWCPPQQCPPVPPSPLPPPPLSGPIIGVTDGSSAAPGQVGEYISSSTSIAYAAYPAVTTQVVSALVVQPGDWDLWATMSMSTSFGGALFNLSPIPAGISDDLAAINAVTAAMTATAAEFNSLNAQAVRGNFSVPTLLAFNVNINQSFTSGLLAGTATLKVRGRRRR